MIYYTSDLHFGHQNVLRFDNRPFLSIAVMDRYMIEKWNERVLANDIVYILGDFCFRSEKPAEWYLQQLNGHKILIIGNHDATTLQNQKALKYFELFQHMIHVQDGDRHICLCHFPIAEWNGFRHGTWHIHGHLHNRKNDTYEFMRTRERALNAGCMINGYVPVTFDELLKNNRKFMDQD